DYRRAAERPQYNSAEHRFDFLRYHDLLYVSIGSWSTLLISYTEFHRESECYTTTIARLDPELLKGNVRELSASPEDWSVIFRTEPCLPLKSEWRSIEGHMAGGRMVHDGRGTIYLASGDYAWDGMFGPRAIPGKDPEHGTPVAQDPDADYGKVVAINVRTGNSQHVSRGHR